MVKNNNKSHSYSVCYEKGFYYIFFNSFDKKRYFKYVRCQTINGIKLLRLETRFDAEYIIEKLKSFNIEQCNQATIENWLKQKRRDKYKNSAMEFI